MSNKQLDLPHLLNLFMIGWLTLLLGVLAYVILEIKENRIEAHRVHQEHMRQIRENFTDIAVLKATTQQAPAAE